MLARVRCNMCMWEGNEEDLVLFEDEDGLWEGFTGAHQAAD